MKATNAIQYQKPKGFSSIINSDSSRAMIDKSIGDPRRASLFVSSLISIVNSNYKLSQCDPGSIISAALRGEIGLGLSMALGEYAVVPYGNRATFQLQVNGLKQLCIRSGKYEKMDFFEVRQGEYKGRDRLTREPIIEWIEDEDDREELPIVGYYGFYKLKDSAGGMFKTIYWSHKQILKHADRYSKAFSLETYEKLVAGKLSKDEANKLANSSPWYSEPNSTAHMKMCMKTIAKQLLGDGSAPKQILDEITKDNLEERTGTAAIFDGDIINPPMPQESNFTVMDADVSVPETTTTVSEPPKKRGRPKKSVEPTEEKAEPEIVEAEIVEDDMSFFFD